MKFNVSQEIREVVRELLPSGDTSASSVAARLRVKFPTNKKIRDAIENKPYFSVSISTAKKKIAAESKSFPITVDAIDAGVKSSEPSWLQEIAEISKRFSVQVVEDEHGGTRVAFFPLLTSHEEAMRSFVKLSEMIGAENARIAISQIG